MEDAPPVAPPGVEAAAVADPPADLLGAAEGSPAEIHQADPSGRLSPNKRLFQPAWAEESFVMNYCLHDEEIAKTSPLFYWQINRNGRTYAHFTRYGHSPSMCRYYLFNNHDSQSITITSGRVKRLA